MNEKDQYANYQPDHQRKTAEDEKGRSLSAQVWVSVLRNNFGSFSHN
jgi:hypothetical protein